MVMLMLGGVWVEETIEQMEIRRTKREKGNEVTDRPRRNFRSKQRWNKIYFFFLELCYSTILKLELYCSTIVKFFTIVVFSIL